MGIYLYLVKQFDQFELAKDIFFFVHRLTLHVIHDKEQTIKKSIKADMEYDIERFLN